MNAILKQALAKRKKFLDETSSTTAIGTGGGLINDNKSTTAKLPFYTGHIVEKSQTGFTGLLNQGATCYLNSLLQSLYMTPELRSAVFEWRYNPTTDPEEKRSIPLQLQKLFARLQLSIKGAVFTKDLTTSFGWTGREVYQQHDVLELSNVLFENLQLQAVGTKLSMVVADLHRGSYKDYVQCLKCNSMRGRNIPFVGLGLDITKSNTFNDALKQYITPEILDDTNKVFCDKCNTKQDSKKGIKLTSLPYFLSIHLKRWTFNFMTLQRIKLNKRVSFPVKFNGNEYLNSDGYLDVNTTDNDKDKDKNNDDDDQPLEYELYSMLIHTGGALGGHYFAYIKDYKTGNWLHFNDSSVRIIPADDIEEWFNPKPTPVNDKDDKKDNKIAPAPIPNQSNDPQSTPTDAKPAQTTAKPADKANDAKPTTTAAASKSIQNASAMGGMDIAAAIAKNLKDKKDQKDLKQKLTDKNAKKLRFLHPYGSAYMLMYRLIDPTRNIIDVSDDLIPANIKQEIAKEDEIYAKQKKEYDYIHQFTTLKVHYNNKSYDIMVKKKESMKIALNKVYNELNLKDDNISLDCIRLRNMKVLDNVPLEPYDDRVDDLISEFKFYDPKHLILETRDVNKQFAAWEPAKISLRMIELDLTSMEWKPEVLIQVNDNALISELRAVCADKLNVSDVNKVRIAYLNEGLALLLSDDTKRIKKDERIVNGNYIHVEICATVHTEGKSLLMDKFDIQLNTLHLGYNLLNISAQDDIKYDQIIDIDVRTELGVLRQMLADKLGINVNECVLRKGWHQQELKNNKLTLEYYKLHQTQQIFIEKGKPLIPNEYLFQIFIEDQIYIRKKKEKKQKKWDEYLVNEMKKQNDKNDQKVDDKINDKNDKQSKLKQIKSAINPDDDNLGDAFLFIGTCVLNGLWTLKQCKEEICRNITNVPPSNLMRIRSMSGNRLTKCFLDSLTLKDNLVGNIKDFTQICCQKTATEEIMTKDKILLYIGRWYPRKMDFGEIIEYSFKKRLKIKTELREELSKYSGIPLNDIRVEHPRPYYIIKPDFRTKICILNWENTNCTSSSTLVSKPWRCKTGQFILYKDDNEKELLTDKDFNIASIANVIQRDIAPLTIYTPQQQIEREKQQKIEKEKEEKQKEKDRQDAIDRMKNNKNSDAQKAQILMNKSMDNDKSNDKPIDKPNDNNNDKPNDNDPKSTKTDDPDK